MSFKPPPPAVAPAKPAAPPAAGLPKAAPKAPAVAPVAAQPGPVAPAVFPAFVPPAQPKMAALLTEATPAQHFAPRDPVQQTSGVRTDPPANRQQSVAADGTLPMAQPLNWQPFNTGGR